LGWLWHMVFLPLLNLILGLLLPSLIESVNIGGNISETKNESLNNFLKNLDLSDKQSLVDCLFEVQTGHIFCRRMASEIVKLFEENKKCSCKKYS